MSRAGGFLTRLHQLNQDQLRVTPR